MADSTPYAVIDVETTGLEPGRDRIIEIAVLRVEGDRITDRFFTLVNPETWIPSDVAVLTGINNDDLRNAPPFFRIARRLVEITEGCRLVAHNARFDYSFLKREFHRLGYSYQRRQICTLHLARKRFPDLPSHALPALCSELGIVLQERHRARADALATLALFRRLRNGEGNGKGSPIARLHSDLADLLLPPALDREAIAALPDATGVYFFHDARDDLIYVGKSVEIRKRVMSHFSNDIQSGKSRRMKDEIHRIDYQVTGSELVALLLESDLIKSRQPRYNRAQRNRQYRYGLFDRFSGDGYRELTLELIRGEAIPIVAFANRKEADRFLHGIVERYQLCQRWCGLHKRDGACFHYHLKTCLGACVGEEPAGTYNSRVAEALRTFYFDHPDFLMVEPGRDPGEAAVVAIRDGQYRGFGFVDEMLLERGDMATVQAAITPRVDNADIRRIINTYRRQHPDLNIRVFG